MAEIKSSFDVPYNERVIDKYGYLSHVWSWFFRTFDDVVFPLGSEKISSIELDEASPQAVEGMKFNKRAVSQVWVDFLIQIVTSETELIESGAFVLVYRPNSETWNLIMQGSPGPDDSGVDLTIDSNGQVNYVSGPVNGEVRIKRIAWRARTLSAKHPSYSSQGVRG